MTRARTQGVLAVGLAACAWGTWPLYVRAGHQSGFVVGFLTMAVMAAPGLALLGRLRTPDRGALIALALVGLADAANVALYFSALSRGAVVVAVFTHYLAPVLVALTAPLVLGEPPSRRARWALPVLLGGLVLVLPTADPGGDALASGLLGAGSAFFYAIVVLGSRRAAVAFDPLTVTSTHAIGSALALLVVFGREALPTTMDGGVGVLLLGALVNGLLGALAFNLGLPRIGAQLTGVLTYLEPMVAAVLGVVVLSEPASERTAAGIVLMLAAGAWTALEPSGRSGLDG